MLLNQLHTIDPDATPSEILKAADLDWKVEKMPRYFKVDNSYRLVEDKYSVVRTDINKELDTCTNRWLPQQNKEIVELAYKVLGENNLKITRAGHLKQGRLILLVADWKTTEVNKRKVGDIVEAKLMLANSHQVGVGHHVKIFWNRLVCTNGMVQGVKATKIIGHTDKTIDLLEKSIEMLPDRFDKFQQNAEKLSETPLDFLEAQALLIKNFGDPELPAGHQPPIVQIVLDLFGGEAMGSELLTSFKTAWALINAMTEYYSHAKHSRSHNRLYSVVQGAGCKNTLKLQSCLSQYLKQRDKNRTQKVAAFSRM